MVTNRRLVENQGPDFYPTPAWATRALMHFEWFDGTILEPCCGDGAMADVLREKYPDQVWASDLHDYRYGEVKDYFSYFEAYDNLVTNPPFNIAEKVLIKALPMTNKKICLLLRLAFLESKRRYEHFFREFPPARVLVFSERLSMYPKGYIIKGGGTTSYAWFVWERQSASVGFRTDTKLLWIPPGFKNKE